MPWTITVVQGSTVNVFAPPIIFGRSGEAEIRQLPSFVPGDEIFQISHKYLSRAHLRMHVVPNGSGLPVLFIDQIGKNPSFWGQRSTALSCGKSMCLQPAEASPETENAVYFPRELNLPKVVLSYSEASPKVEAIQVFTQEKPKALEIVVSVEEDEDYSIEKIPLPKVGSILDELTVRTQERLLDVERLPSLTAQQLNTSQRPEAQANIPKVDILSIGKGWGLGSQAEVLPAEHIPLPIAPAPAPAPAPTSSSKLPQPIPKMGFWEWKAHLDGDDVTAANWKPYKKVVADKLEETYRKGTESTMALDGTYGVCFDDKTYGMVQYRLDDPARWRPVRRRGGDLVTRLNAKRLSIIPRHDSSDDDDGELDISAAAKKNVKKRKPTHLLDVDSDDDDYEDDGWMVDDDDDDDTDSSDDFESLASSSSDAEKKKKRKKNAKKK